MGFIKRYIEKRRMKKIVAKVKALAKELSEKDTFKIDLDTSTNEEVWNKYAADVTKTLDHIVPGTKVEYKGSEGTNANFTVTWPYSRIGRNMYKNIEQNNDPKYYGRYADDNNKFIDKDTNQNITIKQCAEWVDKDGISDFFYCSNCGYKKHYSEPLDICPRCKAIMIGTRSDII